LIRFGCTIAHSPSKIGASNKLDILNIPQLLQIMSRKLSKVTFPASLLYTAVALAYLLIYERLVDAWGIERLIRQWRGNLESGILNQESGILNLSFF
jgi:hypothetical protein